MIAYLFRLNLKEETEQIMQLSILLDALDVIESPEQLDQEITQVAYHSGKVEEGALFVCIKGYKTDGHQFAKQAVEKGAVALVVEEKQAGIDVPQYVVKDTRKALATLGDVYYNHPSKDLNLIGITATNGKTSTSFMTNAILEANRWKTGLIGTVMVKFGGTLVPSVLTTPESLDLHGYFAQMREEEISHVTMEVSSSALELSRVGDVDFNIVALNNISREHTNLHGSFENYYDAKASLIRNASPNEFAVLNLDDDYSARLINETEATVVTYGIDKADGHLLGKNIDLSTGRAQFTVEILKGFSTVDGKRVEPTEFDVTVSVAGYHSVYNAMTAISIGLISGVSIETIQEGIKNFKGVERRFQFIYEGDFKIVDDHFANAGNVDVTLDTLTRMDYNNLHIVNAIRGQRGVDTNEDIAKTLVKWAPKLNLKDIVVSLSESHVGEKDKVLPEEEEAFKEIIQGAGIDIEWHKELPEALASVLDQVEEGDLVLLAGAQGMDFGAKYILNQLVEKRPELDREAVLAPLSERVAGIDESFLKRDESNDA